MNLPHIHVESGDGYDKFWIAPVNLANSVGYNSSELNKTGKLVEQNEALFQEKWDEYFNR